MTNLEFYVRHICQRLVGTIGLILLWRFLWPNIYTTLAALAEQDGTVLGLFALVTLDNIIVRVAALLFLTAWFYRYSDGFFWEWYLLGYKLHQAAISAIRWIVLMIWYLLYPIVISLAMYWGLKNYTPVPYLLKLVTAWVFFFVALSRGWNYPYDRANAISAQLRFQR